MNRTWTASRRSLASFVCSLWALLRSSQLGPQGMPPTGGRRHPSRRPLPWPLLQRRQPCLHRLSYRLYHLCRHLRLCSLRVRLCLPGHQRLRRHRSRRRRCRRLTICSSSEHVSDSLRGALASLCSSWRSCSRRSVLNASNQGPLAISHGVSHGVGSMRLWLGWDR